MTRLVTYNVHRCLGTDRRLDVSRTADVLAECNADIICLQELDVGRARTGGVDQAARMAEELAMTVQFQSALTLASEQYGDAILSRLPLKLVRKAALPTLKGLPGLEPRAALWATIDVDGTALNVLTTHLGLVPREQRFQAEALTGPDWLSHPQCKGPTILAGDFNVTSISRPYRILNDRLEDAQRRLGLSPSIKTFPSAFPAIRIDHIFVSPDVDVQAMSAPTTAHTRVSSDHLPLIMDFAVAPA
jgi:Metal-dependent hydrolase